MLLLPIHLREPCGIATIGYLVECNSPITDHSLTRAVNICKLRKKSVTI